MYLRDISNVENSETSLELIWQLGHVLTITQRENDFIDLMIFAGRQFLADPTNSYNLS